MPNSSLSRLRSVVSVEAEFPLDVGDLLRVGKARIGHHAPQCSEAFRRKEEAGKTSRLVKPQEAAVQQALGGLIAFRATRPIFW